MKDFLEVKRLGLESVKQFIVELKKKGVTDVQCDIDNFLSFVEKAIEDKNYRNQKIDKLTDERLALLRTQLLLTEELNIYKEEREFFKRVVEAKSY